MSPTKFIRTISAPVTELALLLPLLLLWGIIGFGVWAIASGNPGRLAGGILVLILSVPPIFRFQTHVVESYANGKVPEALDAEFFNWIGSMWSILPLFLAILVGLASYHAEAAWGTAGTWFVIVAASAIVPASLAVLAITHSALHALNPVALLNVYRRVGAPFLVAPAYVLVVTMISLELAPLPVSVGTAVGLFTMFSLASLTGALIEPIRLIDEVDIPAPLERTDTGISADVEKERVAALAHAYGFISRNNREGGFKHIFSEIEKDPDPVAAWGWFLDRMLGWEQKQHALFFAQHCVRDMLANNENIPALKTILRCRLIDENFKPFPEDVPAAVQAAENSGNIELATVLKSG